MSDVRNNVVNEGLQTGDVVPCPVCAPTTPGAPVSADGPAAGAGAACTAGVRHAPTPLPSAGLPAQGLVDESFHRAHLASLDALCSFVDALIYDPGSACLDIDALTDDLKPFGARLAELAKFVNEGRDLAARLSQGDLSVMDSETLASNPLVPPLEVIRKNLARSLKLARNVAAGEFDLEHEDGNQNDYEHALNQVIEELRERNKSLERNAYTDPLTGARNRAAFERRVSELWQGTEPFSVAFVDLDNLKGCNDQFGHDEGDRYITQAFLYLSLYFGDDVYRIGGDEFIVLAPKIGEDEFAHSLEECRKALAESDADGVAFSFSYGCSRTELAPDDTSEQLMLDADRKMYAYKLAHKDSASEPDGNEGVALFGVQDRVFEAMSMASPGRYLFIHNIDANESHWSPNAVRDLGLPCEHISDTESVFHDLVHPDDYVFYSCDLHELFGGGKHRRSIQYRMRNAQGIYAVCDCKGFRLDGDGKVPSLFAGVVVNHSLAETSDPTSGLPNIRGLVSAIGDVRQAGKPAGFVIVHVEGVDGLNTEYGYSVGDRVLCEIGQRLVASSMGRSRTFRGRGVKFCVVAEDISPAGLDILAEELRASLVKPIAVGAGRTFSPAVHVASMFMPCVTQQPFTVLRELDQRLVQVMREESALAGDPGKAGEGKREKDGLDAELSGIAALERVDALTGLSRGSDFLQRCNAFRREHPDTPCWLVKVDMGHLRMFNEWHGKRAGDELLADVGGVLAEIEAQGKGVAGYWDQDDFTLLIPVGGVDVAELLARLEKVISARDDAVGFRPSMGVYPLDPGEEVGIDQYARAQFANNRAKKNFKDRIAYFSPAEYLKSEKEHELLSEFQHAISGGSIMFYVQPQYDIESGTVVGGEALARWKRPDGSFVSPADFVPVLEKTGFIAMLDKFIWREVFRWMQRQIEAGQTMVPISINVSRVDVVSFDVAGFLEWLEARYCVPANLVKVEITESAYSLEQEAVGALADRLESAGHSIYMDDFGSGQSSLNTLKNMKVDVIKLDRTFMPVNSEELERSTRIISSVVSMAHSLHLPVIVEGVETADHVALLRSMGVRYVQGFYFGRPMPCEDFDTLIAKPGAVSPQADKGLTICP